jgi:hypothetical protein
VWTAETQDESPARPGAEPAAGELGSPPAAAVLPPRPNLGPEPWPEPALTPGRAVAGGSLLLALIVASAFLIRLRRRPGPRPSGNAAEPPAEAESPATPRERLLRASASLRRSIASRFGGAWDAKTTEELAESPALAEWLGGDRAAAVLALLALADRAKFARPGAGLEPDQSEDWEALADSVRDAAAGASSSKNGR